MAKAKTEHSSENGLAQIAGQSPFTEEQLQGQTLRRGSMLGGANPVIESATSAEEN